MNCYSCTSNVTTVDFLKDVLLLLGTCVTYFCNGTKCTCKVFPIQTFSRIALDLSLILDLRFWTSLRSALALFVPLINDIGMADIP